MSETADPAALLAHAEWLRALARRLVGTSAADDAAQDTFVAALRTPPDASLPARPWLARVLRNVTRMDHRSATRRAAREDIVAAAVGDTSSSSEAPDAAVQRMETFRVLVELVLALAEPLRTTLVRHYFDGNSLADIARRDGVPEGTVRWRHKQAIDQLRARLDARSGGDRHAWLAALAPLATTPPAHAATLTLGGLVVSKVLIGVVVAVAAIGGVVAWRLVPRGDAPPAAPVVAPLSPSSSPPPSARVDAASPAAPAHVRRFANPAERAQLAEQIAAAHARHAASLAAGAAPPRPVHLPVQGDEADNDPALQDEVTRLIPVMRGAMQEVLPFLGDCYDAARPTLGADHLDITAHLSLSSDPDLGTLIDAKQVVDAKGKALSPVLDDCIRAQLLTLELPPLPEDETVEVDYPLAFADAPAGSGGSGSGSN